MAENQTPYSVLIFEDDMDLARQWKQAFHQEGIVAEHAWSFDEAKAHCRKKKFDAIVCDVFIRDNSGQPIPQAGLTFVSSLRQGLQDMPAWGKQVPILAVTGARNVTGFDPLSLMKSLGGAAVMRKPFQPQELVGKIWTLILDREKQKTSSPQISERKS